MWFSIPKWCLFFYLFSSTIFNTALAYQTIIDVLSEDARFETLLRHLQHTRLIPVINQLKTGTLFAPDNDAFANYHGPDITQDSLLYHLLPKHTSASQFHHHQVLESSLVFDNFLRNNTGQRLLIQRHSSIKPTDSIFVNDGRLIETDIFVNEATNIHVISKVLEPPMMLAPSLESKNKDLYNLMDDIGIIHLLKKQEPFTVFYAKPSILHSFNDVEKSYLLSSYGDEDLLHLLDYLIIRGDIYSEDFTGEQQYKTLGGEMLTINVNKEKDIITVNGQRVIRKDLLAANGVLHELQVMPNSQQVKFDTRKYLYGVNATKFVSLLDNYGLGHYLASGVTNFTLLAPDNDSIDEGSIPDNVKKSWLSYHILHGQWYRDQLTDRQLLPSEFKSPQLNDQPQQVPVSLSDTTRKSSLFFGDAGVHDDNLTINNNVIHQLTNPMTLPYDVFSSIVIDLELSSFIATLYVSGVVDKIKKSNGITLFAPTNEAYRSLGLIATYLTHPTGRQDLKSTLEYHAAEAILYDHDLRTSAYSVSTLNGKDTMQVGGTDQQGRVVIGNEDNNGTISESNILMANGVVHKIDTLMMPNSVILTHHKMLVGMNAHRVLEWFEDFSWLDKADDDYILLAPTDRAFTQLDSVLGSGWEQKDPDAYERLVRLHVIPKEQQLQRRSLLGGEIEEYGTLLSDRDRLVIHDLGFFDGQYVQVMGQTGQGARGRVLAKGQLGKYAHMIQLDTVLLPVSRGVFGLPWYWSLAVVLVLSLMGVLAVVGIGYYVWQKWRRSGYETLTEEDEEGNPTNITNSQDDH
ncbi:FAS1 domain-containing protein [Halteromyces radiatus]|uniref:FAS1 domain-containing protein n=1 Tax=Halteromyces radiatus TaxID=101107 RepID=UPI0022206E8D|nr:FAS1 domain-containing protein [Halteromyces radiatus]KAI8097423.1 FAS1 domain-containing protein [Halteromyces radiatus]